MNRPLKNAASIILAVLLAVLPSMICVSAADLQQFTNIPTIYLTLDDNKTVNDITKEDKLPGTFSLRADGYDDIDNAEMTIKGRGNSTWQLPKKPYQINLDTKTDLFGMGASKKWILLANYWDKTLMRNAVTYDLANKINNIFSVEFQYVDVFINGEYRGNYLLTEKIELGSNRIDEDAENGAALFELEQLYRHASEGCDACFVTDSGVHVTMKEPEEDEDYTQDAINEIKNYSRQIMNDVEAAIPQGYDVYSELIDVQSFIDWYIENELAKNYDAAFVTSSYCYIDESGVLHMGPVWDVDVCFGNQDVIYPDTVDNGLNVYNYRSDKGAWYMALFDDETFVELLKERWAELKEDGHIQGMLDKIDELYNYLESSQKHETKKWPDAMQVSNVRDNWTYPGPSSAESYYDFKSEVDYFKRWLTDRIDWLDSQWNDNYCTLSDELRVASVGAGAIKKGNYGVLENGEWKWNYTSVLNNNDKVVTSEKFFDAEISPGSYVCSVKFKSTNSAATDYLMLRLVGTDSSGNETTVKYTPATHVTYVTSPKDDDGYAVVNMKFDTTEYDYQTYHFEIDAYNANVSLKNVMLYSSGEPIKGDVDTNGKITANDALLALQKAVNKITLTQEQLYLADVDGASGITAADALLILQFAVGKIKKF